MEDKLLWKTFLDGKTVGKSYHKVLLSKYETNVFNIDEVKNEKELVWYIKNPFVVIDVDNLELALKLLEILKAASLKFIAYFSKAKGIHFIFKTQNALPYRAGKCWLDIPLEWKSWKSNKVVHVTIKENGEFRKFIKYVDENEIDELPFWLHKYDKISDLYGCEEGDNRNEKLYVLFKKCEKNIECKNWFQFKQYIFLLNKYIFKDSLTTSELENTILNSDKEETFTEIKTKIQKDNLFFKGNTLLYNVFVDKFIETYKVHCWNGELWFYDDCVFNSQVYTNNYKVFMKQAILLHDKINKLQREEIYERLKLRFQDLKANPQEEFIGLKNGLLNFHTNEFQDFTPDIFCIKKINVGWDENYMNGGFKHEIPDKVLDLLSSGNLLVKNFLLDAIANVFFYASNKYELVIFLEGTGGNGKSSFFKMLTNFFGKQNTTALSLQNFKDKFRLSLLSNSMLNISSETKAHSWGEAENFKSVISGDLITIEEKFKQPRESVIYSKLFIAANKLNPLKDEDHALQRRLAVIECKKSIRRDVVKDVTIKERLEKNEKGISETLLKMVLARLQLLIKNQKINIPPIVKKFTFTKGKHYNEHLIMFFCWLKDMDEKTKNLDSNFFKYFEEDNNIKYLANFSNETSLKDIYFEYRLFFYYHPHNYNRPEHEFIRSRKFEELFNEIYAEKYILVKKRINNKRYTFIWNKEDV